MNARISEWLRTLLCLGCFLGGLQGLAQSDSLPDYRRLQIGLVYGQFDQQVDFTPPQAVTAIRRPKMGIALRYFDKQLVGFQVELSYVEAGWQEDLGSDFTELYLRTVDYTELLILTQFSIGRGAVQPLLQLGPYLSYPLAKTERLPEGFEPALQPQPSYYGRPLPDRLNYGLQVGAGLNIELGPLTLQADGRALIGFSDLIRPGDSQVSTSRRRALGGNAGLFYAIGRANHNAGD